jgi:cellulose synthase/poly-beta-1,6-N-acetylglucosamine synthase-like glycosyltransferase
MTTAVLHILFLFLFIYLSVHVAYLLFLSFAGMLSKRSLLPITENKKKIAVLITSHREDDVIVNTVKAAVDHDYPEEMFDIFLAADHLQKKTVDEIRTLRVYVFEVNFEMGSKARSLNFLLNNIEPTRYEIAVVLDGDNIMLPGLLEQINTAFQRGTKAVQVHRSAKNANTPVAILDGISEEINNHFFRRAQNSLGLSPSLIGSGMAFEFATLKSIYNKPGIVDNPACDREVDFEIMKHRIKVKYLDNAILLDEKVATKNVFEKQRRRWLESQLMHIGLFFSKKEKVKHKTSDYWNKLFINLIPPRIVFATIFSLIIILCITQAVLRVDITGIRPRWWLMLLLLYVVAIIIAIPARYFRLSTLKALLFLPSLIFTYLKAALTMKANRKEFVHTPKSFTGDTQTNK